MFTYIDTKSINKIGLHILTHQLLLIVNNCLLITTNTQNDG
jgi:hypothetical protein